MSRDDEERYLSDDLHQMLSLQEHTFKEGHRILGAMDWRLPLQDEVPAWLVPGLLQSEALHVLSSDSGSCKSWLGLELMLSGLYGIPVLGQQPAAPFSSIYLAADSPRWDIGQQLRKLLAGHNLKSDGQFPDTHGIILPLGFIFENPEHINALAQMALHHQCKAFFIDVMLYAHMGDENDNGHMARTVLRAAKYLRDETGLAIFFLHHNAKPKEGMPPGFRGAGTIVQAAEHHLTLSNKNRIITAHVKKIRGDDVLPPTFSFELASANGGRLLSLLEQPEPIEPAVTCAGAIMTIFRHDGTYSRQRLAELLAPELLPKLDNALQYLRRQGRIERAETGEWKRCAQPVT